MSRYAELLEICRDVDGQYRKDEAEQRLAEEYEKDPTKLKEFARSAARHERAVWETLETALLRKQYQQPALLPDLELSLKVSLGESIAVAYGDMNRERIRIRKDLRTKTHIEENRAYDTEYTHWDNTEASLVATETIADAIARRQLNP